MCTMPQMSQVLREHAIGILTAGMSTRAVACELNVNFSTISHLQRASQRSWQYSNRPHNRRAHVTTPATGLPHPTSSPPRSSETSPCTAAATIGLHNQIISAQTVRNRLREAQLHVRHPHRVST